MARRPRHDRKRQQEKAAHLDTDRRDPDERRGLFDRHQPARVAQRRSTERGREADRGATRGGLARIASGAAWSTIQELEARALARRSAGLAALDAGEYEKALIDFTEARALLGDKANVSELLRVTEDLRSKRDRQPADAPPRPTHVAAAPSPPPPRPPMRPAVGRRLAVRETPIPVVETTPLRRRLPPASGLLIVSTTPRGLLVHVDDAAVDLSPMRTKVKPGSHRVALFDGDRKVYEATDRREGRRDRDAGEGSAGGDGRGDVAAARGATAAARRRPTRARSSADRRCAGTGARAATAARAGGTAAGLVARGRYRHAADHVARALRRRVGQRTSARLSAARGRMMSPGPAKVEVRVNGIEKRTTTVMVAPGRTLNVDLR